MDDEAMKNYIPAYGDRLAAIAFCRKQDRERSDKKQPSSLLERLKRKLGDRTRKRKSEEHEQPSTSFKGNANALKKDRRLELGWLDYDHAMEQFKQVRSVNGGGTRQLRVGNSQGVNELLEVSKALFFPKGNSKKGRLVDFELSVQDFRGCDIGQLTIAELYEQTSVKMLRLYLCTKKYKGEQSVVSTSDQIPLADIQSEVEVLEEVIPSDLDDTIPYGSGATNEISYVPIVLDDHSSSSDTETSAGLPEIFIRLHDSENPSEENLLITPAQQETQSQASNCAGPSSAPNNSQIGVTQTRQSSGLEDSQLNIRLHRVNIQQEMIAIFKTPEIVNMLLKVTFVDESGVDAQGVSREAYSAFWQSFFETSADGEDYRIPSLNPHYGLEEWQAVGRILAKGLCDHKVFPIQMAPAFFQALLFGEESVSAEDLSDSFLRFLSDIDRTAVKAAMEGHLSDDEKEVFEDLLDREGSHTIPEGDQVRPVIRQLAHKCIIQNSNYALQAMGGIVQDALIKSFPNVQSIKNLYDRCRPTPKKVCDLFVAEPTTKEQNQSLRYLMQYVRAQDDEGLAKLLRYLTASSIMSVPSITVQFQDVSGLARRPIAHTCGPLLEIPSTYTSYRDFRNEWQAILASGYLSMDIL